MAQRVFSEVLAPGAACISLASGLDHLALLHSRPHSPSPNLLLRQSGPHRPASFALRFALARAESPAPSAKSSQSSVDSYRTSFPGARAAVLVVSYQALWELARGGARKARANSRSR